MNIYDREWKIQNNTILDRKATGSWWFEIFHNSFIMVVGSAVAWNEFRMRHLDGVFFGVIVLLGLRSVATAHVRRRFEPFVAVQDGNLWVRGCDHGKAAIFAVYCGRDKRSHVVALEALDHSQRVVLHRWTSAKDAETAAAMVAALGFPLAQSSQSWPPPPSASAGLQP